MRTSWLSVCALCVLRLLQRKFVLCFFQAEDGIRDLVRSRGLGDVYKRQVYNSCHSGDKLVDRVCRLSCRWNYSYSIGYCHHCCFVARYSR